MTEGQQAGGHCEAPAYPEPQVAAPAASPGAALKFHRTVLQDAWLIEPAPARDHRGFFMRTFCLREFARRGLATQFVQHSTSHSAARGTLRGLHFQRAPHQEIKLVSCLRGAIWDVIVDLRPQSPTFRRWAGFLLSEDNRRQLYVPDGFAHGFQTLAAGAEVGYLISAFYVPEAASGLRYDDPAFAITWPLPPVALSERDRNWPAFGSGDEEGLSSLA